MFSDGPTGRVQKSHPPTPPRCLGNLEVIHAILFFRSIFFASAILGRTNFEFVSVKRLERYIWNLYSSFLFSSKVNRWSIKKAVNIQPTKQIAWPTARGWYQLFLNAHIPKTGYCDACADKRPWTHFYIYDSYQPPFIFNLRTTFESARNWTLSKARLRANSMVTTPLSYRCYVTETEPWFLLSDVKIRKLSVHCQGFSSAQLVFRLVLEKYVSKLKGEGVEVTFKPNLNWIGFNLYLKWVKLDNANLTKCGTFCRRRWFSSNFLLW